MYDKYGQFIDGKWQKSASGETYDVINPATEEVIGKASKANSSDVQKALKIGSETHQRAKKTCGALSQTISRRGAPRCQNFTR